MHSQTHAGEPCHLAPAIPESTYIRVPVQIAAFSTIIPDLQKPATTKIFKVTNVLPNTLVKVLSTEPPQRMERRRGLQIAHDIASSTSKLP